MRRKSISFFLILLSLGILSATTKEGCKHKTKTIVFESAADVDDAHLNYFEDRPENCNAKGGESNELPIYKWTVYGVPVTGRAVLKFALDKIPQKSKIVSAKLSLFGFPDKFPSNAIPQGNKGDNIVVLQRVIENWKEETVTWNNQPASTAEGQIELPISTSQWEYNIVNFDVTDLVKQMNATNNYGFSIRLKKEETYRSIGFLSNEYSDPAKRPRLIINYKN
ncbi:MAG: DNRLRE domain-containing protein [Bacteroidota bacterium]